MGSKTKNTDRRKYPRIESKVKIRYKEFHNPLKVYKSVSCLNIGVGGCRFETFENLNENLVLTIYINIPVPYSYQIVSAKIFAKVVQTETADKKYFCSVYFLAIDRKGAIALKQWMDKEVKARRKRKRHRSRKRSSKTAAVA